MRDSVLGTMAARIFCMLEAVQTDGSNRLRIWPGDSSHSFGQSEQRLIGFFQEQVDYIICGTLSPNNASTEPQKMSSESRVIESFAPW
jgi:hypothetical protein